MLNLQILDSKTGEVKYSENVYDVDFEKGINCKIQENFIILTYFNSKVNSFVSFYHSSLLDLGP